MLLADTPQWVIDAKNYSGFIVSFVAALGIVWKYLLKPYFERQERDRKEAVEKARAERKQELDSVIMPLQQTMKSTGDKVLLLGDAVHATNNNVRALTKSNEEMHKVVNERLDSLTQASEAVHKDVREHMAVEEGKN